MSANRYNILFTRRARKDVHRLDKPVVSRVSATIDAPADHPRPPGCIKVKGEEKLWRIRVGDWRIGYEIDDSTQEVTVIRSVTVASSTIDVIANGMQLLGGWYEFFGG